MKNTVISALARKRRQTGLRRPFRERSRSEGGAAMVEFALVLPLLLLLVIGLVDFGRAINYWIDSNHLSSSAARWAVVDKNPGAGDGTSLQEYIRLQADTVELRDSAQVCIEFPEGTANVGDPVEARMSFEFDWIPFLEFASSEVTGSATMRLEQVPTEYSAECAPA